MNTRNHPDVLPENVNIKGSRPSLIKYRQMVCHLFAFFAVMVWGTTFVSTKVLINSGLQPVEILLYRFVLAYIGLLIFSRHKIIANTWKDELLMFFAGLCGGSLYFIAENTALGITWASNVSLLICTAPIFTLFLARIFYKERLWQKMLYGSLLALAGVGMVVLNGSLVLRINPLGDLLTLIAAILWALYCLILKRLGNAYSTFFITRKVFFYGIVSLGIYFCFFPPELNIDLLSRPVVYLNLLFLGIVASMLCYVMWNRAVRELGASKAANYIYIIPLVTLVTSALVLSETLTIVSLIGTACIIGGVYMAER